MFKIKPLSRAVISASFVGAAVLSGAAVAQEQNELEEVVVVGSQIKGASITTALPVSVISAGDIDALGLGLWRRTS